MKVAAYALAALLALGGALPASANVLSVINHAAYRTTLSTARPAVIYGTSVNLGGGVLDYFGATFGFVADQGPSFQTWSSVSSTNAVINTSHVQGAPAQSLYQTQRYGTGFTYVIGNLSPNKPVTLRLHFAESFFTLPGQRVFNVTINGQPALVDFDILRYAGAKNVAFAPEFNAVADSTGSLTIGFSSVVNYATCAGIEILKNK